MSSWLLATLAAGLLDFAAGPGFEGFFVVGLLGLLGLLGLRFELLPFPLGLWGLVAGLLPDFS
jgi:hypothetical protein